MGKEYKVYFRVDGILTYVLVNCGKVEDVIERGLTISKNDTEFHNSGICLKEGFTYIPPSRIEMVRIE